MNIAVRGKKFTVLDNKLSWWWKLRIGKSKWENETLDVLDLFLKKDKDMIDIGAWIFPIALYSSKLCNKVFALEPVEDNFNNGIKNQNLSGITNIYADSLALWTTDKPMRIQEVKKNDSSTFAIGNSGNFIKTITFKQYSKKNDLSNVNLVKMDIEGAEGMVLPLMKEWLHKNKVTLLVSKHPQFKVDKKRFEKIILDSIKDYPYIYEITTNELLCTYENKEVNKKWKKIK